MTGAELDRLLDDRVAEGWFSVHRDAFRDPAVFELEMRHIFEATWNYVALESQLPRPHDFLTTTIGRTPVVVMRDANGQLGCFLNSCRHKGATIFHTETGNGAHHSCPYHGWTYDSGGQCIAITSKRQANYPAAFDRAEHGLRRVARFGSYRGLLFASLRGEVPPLADYLGDARQAIDLVVDQSAQGIELVPGAVSFTFNGNWKFQLENSSDTYHFMPTHASYIEVLDKRRAARKAAPAADGSAGSIYEDIGAQAAARRGSFTFAHGHVLMWGDNPAREARPLYPSLAEIEARVGANKAKWMMHVRNLTVFPNMQIAENASLQLRIIRPLAVDRTEMQTYCLAPKGEPAEARVKRLRQYEDFFNPSGFATPDDAAAYEACQRGLDARDIDWQQGYVRGIGAMHGGGNADAAELGVLPQTASVGGYLMGDETIFHGNYRAWLALLKRGVALDANAQRFERPRMSTDAIRATDLLYLEGALLDAQDWDGWLALYEPDAEFWMPAWKSASEPTDDPQRELSMIYYPSRAGLEDRIQRIRSGKSVASTPLRRTAHISGNVRIAGKAKGVLSVHSVFNVHVYDTRQKTQHVFFGRVTHGLVMRAGGLRIRSKKIILANDCIPTMLDIYCV